ncbi:MAG: hypothetical protein WCC14_19990 [Acidobacteriaceae bacterium]
MSLVRELMGRPIISVAMGRSRSRMGVSRKVVQFCCSIMDALRHRYL